MTVPSPLIMETLAAHRVVRIDATGVRLCSCGRPWTPTHAAQALADAGVLGPEQVLEREAAALVEAAHAVEAVATESRPMVLGWEHAALRCSRVLLGIATAKRIGPR